MEVSDHGRLYWKDIVDIVQDSIIVYLSMPMNADYTSPILSHIASRISSQQLSNRNLPLLSFISSRSHLSSLVAERNSKSLCGYPLCNGDIDQASLCSKGCTDNLDELYRKFSPSLSEGQCSGTLFIYDDPIVSSAIQHLFPGLNIPLLLNGGHLVSSSELVDNTQFITHHGGNSTVGPNSASNNTSNSVVTANSASNNVFNSAVGPNSASNSAFNSVVGPNSASNNVFNSAVGPNSASNSAFNSAVGPNSASNNVFNSAVEPNSASNNVFNSAVGPNSASNNTSSSAVGPNSASNNTSSSAVGPNSASNNTSSSAVGPNSASNNTSNSVVTANSASNNTSNSAVGPNNAFNSVMEPCLFQPCLIRSVCGAKPQFQAMGVLQSVITDQTRELIVKSSIWASLVPLNGMEPGTKGLFASIPLLSAVFGAVIGAGNKDNTAPHNWPALVGLNPITRDSATCIRQGIFVKGIKSKLELFILLYRTNHCFTSLVKATITESIVPTLHFPGMELQSMEVWVCIIALLIPIAAIVNPDVYAIYNQPALEKEVTEIFDILKMNYQFLFDFYYNL